MEVSMTREQVEAVRVSDPGWAPIEGFVCARCTEPAYRHPFAPEIWGCKECGHWTYSVAVYFREALHLFVGSDQDLNERMEKLLWLVPCIQLFLVPTPRLAGELITLPFVEIGHNRDRHFGEEGIREFAISRLPDWRQHLVDN